MFNDMQTQGQYKMKMKPLSLLLALLLLAGIISAQEEAPSPQAAPPAVAEETADDTDEDVGATEDDLKRERFIREMEADIEQLGQNAAVLHQIWLDEQNGKASPHHARSRQHYTAEWTRLARKLLRTQAPMPMDDGAFAYLMAYPLQGIKSVLFDKPELAAFGDGELQALREEYLATATAIHAQAHRSLVQQGLGREAERLRKSAAHFDVPAEVVAAMQKEADAAALEGMEKLFHILLDLQEYELGASQDVLRQMKEKGADGALVARLEAELQAASDRRLLALARSFRGGVTVFGSPHQISTLQDWARNARLLPPGKAALPQAKALWAEVTAADLEKRLRYALRPERSSAPLQEVERMLKQAREAGLPDEAMAGAERIVRDETVFQLQRSLWSLLGSQGFDYDKAGQQLEQAAMILDYAAQHGVDEATLEEWRRQVKWLRDARLRRDFEWRLSTAKFDEAEALLKEAVDGGLDEAQAASLRQRLQTARQERQKWEFWSALGKRDADKAAELLQLIEQQGVASNEELSDMREDLRMLKARRLEDEYRRAVQHNDEAKAEEVLSAARASNVPEETLRHWHDAFHPKRRY